MKTHTTLKQPFTLTGIGIHSGQTTTITFFPKEEPGIRFIRTPFPEHPIDVSPETIGTAKRATHLENFPAKIATPEHVLSACMGMGLTSVKIECSNEEIPIMDGSALPFAKAIEEAGLISTPYPIQLFKPRFPHSFSFPDGSRLLLLPSDQTHYTYVLEYDHPVVGNQVAHFNTSTDSYLNEIAPARTFGFESELAALAAKGLARGGSLDNAVVIGQTEYLNPLRFENELSRHKLLDVIGDFALLGRPIIAHIVAIKTGHAQHAHVVQALSKFIV